MNKDFSIASLLVSAIALGVSVFSVYCNGICTNTLGVAVDILGILIALLVAWQIFTTLDAKRKINGIDTKIEAEFEKYNYSVKAYIEALEAIRHDSNASWEAIDKYFSAVDKALSSGNSDTIAFCVDRLLEYLRTFTDSNCFVFKGSKEQYRIIARELKSKEVAKEIISYVDKAKEHE